MSVHWNSLKEQIIERTYKPLESPSYVIFFFVSIIGVSAIGIWLELNALLKGTGSLGALRIALITYFWTLATTSCMQVIWTNEVKHFTAFSIGLLTTCAILGYVCSASRNDLAVFFWGGIALILSLWMWWMVNAKPTNLFDHIDDIAPVGGNDNKEPKGNLNEFKH